MNCSSALAMPANQDSISAVPRLEVQEVVPEAEVSVAAGR
jgi:hypothetical protein